MTPLWYILTTLVAVLYVLFGYVLCLVKPTLEKRLQARVQKPTTPAQSPQKLPTPTPLRTV